MGSWIETVHGTTSRDSFRSHPTWVRGLKLSGGYVGHLSMIVASYVGAWIETFSLNDTTAGKYCRILRGCVD